MKYLFAALGALCLLTACDEMPVGNTNVPQPAKVIDLPRYLGTWYEMARYENRFERDCEGVTAQYRALDEERIEVINTCRQGAVDGPEKSATGKARIVHNSGFAKLKVSFFGPFYFGNYWVLDVADDYSWSIVGEPSGKYLWILTREPVPADDVKAMLIDRVQALGYDTSLLYFTKQPPMDAKPQPQS